MARPTRAIAAGLGLLLAAYACSAEPDAAKPTPPDEWRVDIDKYDAALFAIWGHDNGPLWTVGADDGKGPLLLHHPHLSSPSATAKADWTRVDTSGFPGDLWWIHGPDAKTAYLVGAGGRVVRWDRAADAGAGEAKGTLTAMPTPAKRVLYGCWAADATHIWAVGGDPMGVERGVVLLSDGATWTEVSNLPPVPKGVSFFKVFGSSPTDVHVIGVGGVKLHFDGSAWTRETLNSAAGTATTQRLITIHGDESLQVIVGGTGNGAVYERQLKGGSATGSAGAWKDVSPDAIQALNGVRVRGGKAWAVGFRGTLVDRTPAGWVLRDEVPTDLDLHGVFIDKAGVGWAVGGNLFSKPASEGVILRR